MARDDASGGLKPAGPPRSAGKKRGLNPMFIGIIIGLLLGIGLALGLAIWLNRANNPFVEKSRPVEALQTLPAKSLNPPSSPPATTAKADPEKPRFDFYQILPGEKTGKSETSAPPKVAAEPPAKPVPEAKPAVRVESKPEPKAEPKLDVKPASNETFFLQAGAFQNQSDAENMKAKVAFAGFEANVRAVNLPDKGTLYRVRLGPYKSQDEVNRIKSALSQGGIGAVVVKGSD
ncbi:MAG: SPOR domain-containing protein [Betaproteobacteria bacterium]|nr:SPOR domain-containing protein [Betaproteobacteria bacterium]